MSDFPKIYDPEQEEDVLVEVESIVEIESEDESWELFELGVAVTVVFICFVVLLCMIKNYV